MMLLLPMTFDLISLTMSDDPTLLAVLDDRALLAVLDMVSLSEIETIFCPECIFVREDKNGLWRAFVCSFGPNAMTEILERYSICH